MSRQNLLKWLYILMNAKKITLAAYQGTAVYESMPATLNTIIKVIRWAEGELVDILCFPECYLQGYILDAEKARMAALDLSSKEFIVILESLRSNKLTVILGLIEKDGHDIFNTAVVIEKGILVGKYRKHFIHNKEAFFICGTDFPVFEKKGVRYGINICYDSRFPETADAIVKQGAQIIFCPLNNSLPRPKADEWRHKHIEYLKNKAQYSGCWIVSSDVVESSEANTGYGCTCLVNPKGEVIQSLPHLKEGKLLETVSIKQ